MSKFSGWWAGSVKLRVIVDGWLLLLIFPPMQLRDDPDQVNFRFILGNNAEHSGVHWVYALALAAVWAAVVGLAFPTLFRKQGRGRTS